MFGNEVQLSGTYAPTYGTNDDACLDALSRADESSDTFWSDVRDIFAGDTTTTFGDAFESGMDAWGDHSNMQDVCNTGGW